MTYDVVVVGGGCSGMSAALTLARFGRRVLLVEKDRRLAPVLRGFERHGVHFDTGFHYVGGLGRGEILETLFRFLGLARHLHPLPFRSDGFDLCRFETSRREVAMPYGAKLFEDRLGADFPGQQEAVGRYLQEVRQVFSASPFLNLRHSFAEDELFDFPDSPPLLERLAALTSDRVLQTLLALPCLLYGVPPSASAFTNHALVAGSYFSSVHGLQGGGRALAAAFEQELAAAGVDVVCGSPVVSIVTADRAVRGVALADGREYRAGHCLFTGHPTLLPGLLAPGNLRPAYCKRLAQHPETPSAFMLFGILQEPVTLLEGRNLFLTRAEAPHDLLSDGDATLYLAGGERLPDGRRAFTAMGTAPLAAYAPWLASQTGARPPAYRDFKRRQVAAWVRRIEKACPELAGRMQIVDAATPLTMRDWAASPHGSLYGVQHVVDDFPVLPMTKVRGLLLAGQSVLLPGVLGAMVSAMVACSLTVGLSALRKELRQCSDSASS